jgi:hypothetical protein
MPLRNGCQEHGLCLLDFRGRSRFLNFPGRVNRMKRVFAHMTRYPRLHAALRENEDGKG